jgi:YVTN family beta-propeller protein
MLPPEEEVSAEFELPHAGLNYVYAANPDADSVAVIDASTLAISSVEAGDEPRFLQTLAGVDKAIVLNVGSEDATVITTVDGVSTARSVEVQPGSNAIAVAPDGNHAVVYYNSDIKGGSRTGSFQDVSVLDLSAGGLSKTDMTVGFLPSAVHFSSDSTRAFVISQSGVSVLNLAATDGVGSGIAATIPVAGGLDARALDISVTGDGQYALARSENDASLRLVDLTARTTTTLDLSAVLPVTPDGSAGAAGSGGVGGAEPTERGAITDVDLAPSSEFALAVVRSASTLVRIPLPSGFTDPSQVQQVAVTDNTVGSVTLSGDGRYALLYTTALDTAERLTIVDLQASQLAPVTIDVKKPIRSVAIASDGKTALVIHKKLPGDPTLPGLDIEQVIDYSFGYTLVQLATGFSKLQLTDADVESFTLVPDGSAIFLLFNALYAPEVHRARLHNFFVTRLPLGSPPLSVGTVPGSSKVFVGQEHPDGRITFVDWQTLDVRSVTGFELNSKIRE